MAYNIELLNQICTDLGATSGHAYNIHAYNAICDYLGITSGHKYEIHALNAIAVYQGLPGGYEYNIEALNAICQTSYDLEVECLVLLGAMLKLSQEIHDKLLFYGFYSEIVNGKMPNKVGSDWLTVSGTAGSETYVCPNTAPYIAADTDYIWFKSDTTQRTTTTSELVGYDLQRTPVKYDDATPYQIRMIAIIKAGETLTSTQLDILFKWFELPVLWNNSLNAFGHVKGNRLYQNLYPGMPINLTLTGISGGVKLDWTDCSYGTAETEIWGRSNSNASALLYTINAGIITKNDTIAPVDLRYYKIRAKKEGIYSAFTPELSIALLGPELIANQTFDVTTWWTKNTGITIENGYALFTNCSGKSLHKANILVSGKKYIAECDSTTVVNPGAYITKYGNGFNLIAEPNGHKTATFVASGADFGFYALNGYTGTIDNVSVKQILYP